MKSVIYDGITIVKEHRCLPKNINLDIYQPK